MPILAEMSDAVALAILGIVNTVVICIVGIVTAYVKLYIEGIRARQVASKVEEVAVKQDIAALAAEQRSKSIGKLTEQIEEIHKATNSLVDRLVESTKIESHGAGVKDEQDRRKAEEQEHFRVESQDKGQPRPTP